MSDVWTVTMMISGGLFVGAAVFIAWERVPSWRASPPTEFMAAFASTLRRVDRVQPILLTVLLVSTLGFAIMTDGLARTLSLVGAAGFLAILIGSVVWLVPIQRSLSSETEGDVEPLRTRWLLGHQIRTVAALALFVLAVAATTI